MIVLDKINDFKSYRMIIIIFKNIIGLYFKEAEKFVLSLIYLTTSINRKQGRQVVN